MNEIGHRLVATTVALASLAKRRVELATISARYAGQQRAAKQAPFASGSATALEVTQAGDSVQAANKRLARALADSIEAELVVAYHPGTLLKNVAMP